MQSARSRRQIPGVTFVDHYTYIGYGKINKELRFTANGSDIMIYAAGERTVFDFCSMHEGQKMIVVEEQSNEFNFYFGITEPILCCPLLFCDDVSIVVSSRVSATERCLITMFARQKANVMKMRQYQQDNGK